MAMENSGIGLLRWACKRYAAEIEQGVVRTLIEAAVDVIEGDVTNERGATVFTTVATQIAFLFADDDGLGIADVYDVCGFDDLLDQLAAVRTEGGMYPGWPIDLIDVYTARTLAMLNDQPMP